MEYWLSYQRSRFIVNGQTRVITLATAVEVAGIALLLFVCIGWLGMIGVVAGSVAQISGRLASNLFLFGASRTRGRVYLGTAGQADHELNAALSDCESAAWT